MFKKNLLFFLLVLLLGLALFTFFVPKKTSWCEQAVKHPLKASEATSSEANCQGRKYYNGLKIFGTTIFKKFTFCQDFGLMFQGPCDN
jgi:hypothetical protein